MKSSGVASLVRSLNSHIWEDITKLKLWQRSSVPQLNKQWKPMWVNIVLYTCPCNIHPLIDLSEAHCWAIVFSTTSGIIKTIQNQKRVVISWLLRNTWKRVDIIQWLVQLRCVEIFPLSYFFLSFLAIGSWLASIHRVVNAHGRLLSTTEP